MGLFDPDHAPFREDFSSAGSDVHVGYALHYVRQSAVAGLLIIIKVNLSNN